MKQYQSILVNRDASIRDALKIIDSGAMKIALVVDTGNKLLGTISDGDIRRALLNRMGLDDSIREVYNDRPITCEASDSKDKILQLSLSSQIHQIPIVDAHGCLVGIVDRDDLVTSLPKTNKVVLMAGGLGTRLTPLTNSIPKPMLHVGSKPILETIIENFVCYGYCDFILSVNYKSHIIEEYFGDGRKFGVNIRYVHEKKQMGTAGALSLMRKELNEAFFVMNADLLTNINFEQLHDFHKLNKSFATMAVREYDLQIPYGVVNILDGLIASIEEKPVKRFYVSGGIYMLEPKSLELIPEKSFFDMPSLFQKIIQAGKNAASFPIREYWLDIGRLRDYERANNEYGDIFN